MSQSVPFQNLGRLHDSIAEELRSAIDEVIANSSFVGARSSKVFEEHFASAHGVRRAVGTGSGTDALALALRALGVGPGDEVVVPALTFVATAEAVVHVGATPVLADVDPMTLLLGESQVDDVRTALTRAVIPVHLFGHMVPFDVIDSWKDSGLIIVEDAAQAHLGEWRGRHVGSSGDVACFSFYPGKNLGAFGDGGAVISRDDDVAEAVASLRDHGRSSKYLHDRVGWCSRLDGLQAAVLEVKLRHLPAWTAARRALAARYRDQLGELLVPWEEGAVHHLLVARVDASKRDDLLDDLRGCGVGAGVHYPVALSDQPSLAKWRRSAPAAEAAAASVISLPMDPLMSEGEVDIVCAELRARL